MANTPLHQNLLDETELAADVTAIDPQAAPRSRTGGMMERFKSAVLPVMLAAAGTVGLADNSAEAQEKSTPKSKKPAAVLVAKPNTTTVAARTTTPATTGRSTGKQSPARTVEAAAEQLPEVNQEVLDNMKKYWDSLNLSAAERRRHQAALDTLLEALRRKDYERCKELMTDHDNRVDFEGLYGALYGSNMFIYGEDGWKVERNDAAVIYTYMPQDTSRPGQPSGPLAGVVQSPALVSETNPLGIDNSFVTGARTQREVLTVLEEIKKRTHSSPSASASSTARR